MFLKKLEQFLHVLLHTHSCGIQDEICISWLLVGTRNPRHIHAALLRLSLVETFSMALLALLEWCITVNEKEPIGSNECTGIRADFIRGSNESRERDDATIIQELRYFHRAPH